jgi:hypothetical protein
MRPSWSARSTHLLRVAAAAGALVAASGAVPATTSGAIFVSTARTASAPKPSAEATARLMHPRTGFHTPKFGAAIPGSDLAGTRVFANTQVGFGLTADHGQTFPARTTNGGKTWTIDGPQFHVDAADGAEGVSFVGIVSANEEFAYGASVVDVSTNAGHTWWETFLGENVTAVVPGRQGLVAFVQQSTSNRQLNPIVTWQYVSDDGGRHWRYSTSFAATA